MGKINFSALDLENSSLNSDDGQLVCDEYMNIMNAKKNEPENNHYKEVAGMYFIKN